MNHCKNCKYYDFETEDRETTRYDNVVSSLCRRYPPSRFSDADYVEIGQAGFIHEAFVHVQVQSTDWCGEFVDADRSPRHNK